MPRVSMHMTVEGKEERPTLRVNGHELTLTDKELEALLCDVLWARDRVKISRALCARCGGDAMVESYRMVEGTL